VSAKPAFPDSSYAASERTDKKSLQQSNLIHEPVTDQLITDLKTPLSGWELIKGEKVDSDVLDEG